MDYIVHGILQARILEWVAFPFSRGSSQPRNQTQVSWIAGTFFTSWATREAFASLERKGNHKQNEDNLPNEEKIIANDANDKGLISKIYKKLQLSIKQIIHQKMGRRPKQTFLQRRHTDDQNTLKSCSISLIVDIAVV